MEGIIKIMILNIYKEKSWTSFDVVAKIKGMLRGKYGGGKIKKVEKVGHAGTLDPLAEGVLIVLTGNDTKRQDEFMKMEKTYLSEIAFGITTPTYDLEIIPNVNDKQMKLNEINKELNKILSEFVGIINQKVPPYSAVKVGGKRLYKKARKGEIKEDSIPLKNISIYEINILNSKEIEIETKIGLKTFPVFEIEVRCSSGTYIRSLANDLGRRIGTGATLVDLTRTKIGNFEVKDSVKISDLRF